MKKILVTMMMIMALVTAAVSAQSAEVKALMEKIAAAEKVTAADKDGRKKLLTNDGWKKFLTNGVGTEFYYNVYQKNEWYDESTVFEVNDGDYELDENIYLPNCNEVTQKVLLKCIEHGCITAKSVDGSFSIIYYLGYKEDTYLNRYYTFAYSGWFGGEE